MDIYDGPPREGTRGGLEQFTWGSIKSQSLRDRECYLGQSIKVGVQGKFGRFTTNDWWTRSREQPESLKTEINIVQKFEDELMQEALGLKPKRLLLIKGDLTEDQKKEVRLKFRSVFSKNGSYSQLLSGPDLNAARSENDTGEVVDGTKSGVERECQETPSSSSGQLETTKDKERASPAKRAVPENRMARDNKAPYKDRERTSRTCREDSDRRRHEDRARRDRNYSRSYRRERSRSYSRSDYYDSARRDRNSRSSSRRRESNRDDPRRRKYREEKFYKSRERW